MNNAEKKASSVVADQRQGGIGDLTSDGMEEIICAIDMGSKTFKLVMGQKVNDRVTTQLLKKENLELGKEVAENHKMIRKEKLIEIENVLSRFKKICKEKEATKILAIATSAVRDAGNKKEVFDMARNLGIILDIAEGSREGEVGYLAATYGASNKLVIDMGSQSFQLTWKISKKIVSQSIDGGYKIAYNKFIRGASTFAAAQERYREFLDRNLRKFPKRTNQFIALSSKTITGFVTGKKKDETSGSNLSKEALNEKIQTLSSLTSEQFKSIMSNTIKAYKIFPGIILLNYVMERSGHNKALITDAELPVGLIVEYFQNWGVGKGSNLYS